MERHDAQDAAAPRTAQPMTLQPITEADWACWQAFRAALYHDLDPALDGEEMRSILSRSDWHCWLVMGAQSRPIGLVEISLRNVADGCISSPVPYLEGLYLVPECQGQGIGTRVMAHLDAWCRAEGFTELATDAELSNEQAQRFYRTLGFEEVDRVVVYRRAVSRNPEETE